MSLAQAALFDVKDGEAPTRALVPPIKCQGIKTKLVPFIASTVRWDGTGRWVEPFVGSGVVAFSLQPDRALLADTNPHLIRFYRAIQDGEITPARVRVSLKKEGALLVRIGEAHYYEVRERFNHSGDPLDFLFLNRACFNGLIRFNRKGKFNVPWNRKPERFAPAYVTKIVNQVARVSSLLMATQWDFVCRDWEDVLDECETGDYVYADPPYAGRFSDYYNKWDDDDSRRLLERLVGLPCDFSMSTWAKNKYRTNGLLQVLPAGCEVQRTSHFYHLGATEDLRNEVEEAVVTRGHPTSSCG